MFKYNIIDLQLVWNRAHILLKVSHGNYAELKEKFNSFLLEIVWWYHTDHYEFTQEI